MGTIWRIALLSMLIVYSLADKTLHSYEHSVFPPKDLPIFSNDDFLITRHLGTGKFSDVFEAEHKNDEKVVLKCLKPVSMRKIRREITILQDTKTVPSMTRLLGLVLPHQDTPTTLVLKHAGKDAQWLCHKDDDPLTDYDIRYYLCHLLVALGRLHARNIVHRDVKPRNVLINRNKSVSPLTLIDLGLADYLEAKMNVRVASRHFKAPELLLGNTKYDTKVDLWGVGCILGGLLWHREPLLRGKDRLDQLRVTIELLGTKDLTTYLEKHKLTLKKEAKEVVDKCMKSSPEERVDWTTYKEDVKPAEDALELLDELLIFDHDKRLSAKQAIEHRFFDVVRDRVLSEVQLQEAKVVSTVSQR